MVKRFRIKKRSMMGYTLMNLNRKRITEGLCKGRVEEIIPRPLEEGEEAILLLTPVGKKAKGKNLLYIRLCKEYNTCVHFSKRPINNKSWETSSEIEKYFFRIEYPLRFLTQKNKRYKISIERIERKNDN